MSRFSNQFCRVKEPKRNAAFVAAKPERTFSTVRMRRRKPAVGVRARPLELIDTEASPQFRKFGESRRATQKSC
jgi:hypothetical protein